MNKMEASIPSDWLIIARKDWDRIHHMLEYDDFEAMFPYEKLKG